MKNREQIAIEALINIRDSSYRSALMLRAIADEALQQIMHGVATVYPHGHVVPRKDGIKVRCGGPSVCPVCKKEKQEYLEWIKEPR